MADDIDVLRRHARRLNRRWWRWAVFGPTYHLLADALYWQDEVPLWSCPFELSNTLRLLWHYRTGLIVGKAHPYRELWELGKQLFPRWVGFHPSRCRPVRRYTILYRAARIATARCPDEWEREMGLTDAEQDVPPDRASQTRGRSDEEKEGR